MSGYFGRDGKPITLGELIEGFNDNEKKRVAFDNVGGADISTVWLGLNHSFGDGPPLIFETMVFGGPLDGAQDRYSTLEQAEAGHAATLERVKAA